MIATIAHGQNGVHALFDVDLANKPGIGRSRCRQEMAELHAVCAQPEKSEFANDSTPSAVLKVKKKHATSGHGPHGVDATQNMIKPVYW